MWYHLEFSRKQCHLYLWRIYWYRFSFNIDVQGAELFLEEMKVSWDNSIGENLNKIEIQ